jgi:hypothetical protein
MRVLGVAESTAAHNDDYAREQDAELAGDDSGGEGAMAYGVVFARAPVSAVP